MNKTAKSITNQKYYIGMDAGGTGTSVLISDGKTELFRTATGGLNCNSFSRQQIRDSLHAAAAELRERGFAPEACLAAGIGVAGSNNPQAAPILRRAMAELNYRCPIGIYSDAEAALFGALEEEDGILLISGTGSVCLGQTDQGQVKYRAGGFGHLIDDEGSAYALGRDILTAVVKASDGRGPATSLEKILFTHLGISALSQLVSYVYDRNHTKKEIAGLAPLLSLPENQNDEASAMILNKALSALLEMTEAVCRKMECRCHKQEIPLVLHGSVLEKNRRLTRELTLSLSRSLPRLRIAPARADAAAGAMGLVRRRPESC